MSNIIILSGGGAAETFTYDGVTMVNSRSIAPLTYGSAGDLLVIIPFAFTESLSGTYNTTVSGWTRALQPSISGTAAGLARSSSSAAVFYKVLDGTETSENFMSSGAHRYRTLVFKFTISTATILAKGANSSSEAAEAGFITAANSLSDTTGPIYTIGAYSINDDNDALGGSATFSPPGVAVTDTNGTVNSNYHYRIRAYVRKDDVTGQNSGMSINEDSDATVIGTRLSMVIALGINA